MHVKTKIVARYVLGALYLFINYFSTGYRGGDCQERLFILHTNRERAALRLESTARS